MLAAFLLVLGAATAAVCNKPCLDLCLPFHSESFCFSQCGCAGSSQFPAQIVTEDGRRFAVAPVPPKPTNNDDSYRYMGCKIECADVCFRFTAGYAQLNCVVGHCGCAALVSEVLPPPPPPQPYYPYAPQPAAPAAPAPVTPPAQPFAPQPVAPQPIAAQPIAPQPIAPQPIAPQPIAPQPVAPQPAAAQGTIKVPFTTQDGRTYEISPLVSDSVFFQGCATCVDTCSRLTSISLVEKCLTFCSCPTSVAEVPRRPF